MHAQRADGAPEGSAAAAAALETVSVELRPLFDTYRHIATALFAPQQRLGVAAALLSEVRQGIGADCAVVLLDGALLALPADVAPVAAAERAAGEEPPRATPLLVDHTAQATPVEVQLARRCAETQLVLGPHSLDPDASADAGWQVAVPLADALGPAGAVLFGFRDAPRELVRTGWFEALAVEFREALERARLREVKAQLREQARRDTEAVAASERRLRGVLDGLFVFVGLLDADGTLLEANRAALDAAGLRLADVVDRPFWEAPWWSWNPAVQQQLRDAIASAARGALVRYDVDVRMAGDALRTIDFQLAPLYDDAGFLTHLVPSGLDITARKAESAERELRLHEEQVARERAEAMQQLSEALGAASDSDSVFDAVARHAAETVGAAFANVAVRTDRPDAVQLRNGPGIPGDIARRWPEVRLDADTPVTQAFRHGALTWAATPAEIAASFPSGSADAAAAGLQALGAVPVIAAEGSVAAVIGLGWTRPQPLDSATRATITALVAVVGQALERARRFDAERHVAQALQQVLLPATLPRFAALGLTARYLAAESTLAVGGDWYECFDAEDGRLIVAVGDVVGRGLEAAAAVGQLRAAVSALATSTSSPAALLDRLDAFVRHFPAAVCTTVVCVELEVDTGAFRYACAGHPPPLQIDAQGTPRPLQGGRSTPLGVTATPRPLAEGVLGAGERLLLYTDGLIERRGELLDEGFARLSAAVEASANLGTDAQLVDEVLRRCIPPAARDDVCVLMLHRRTIPNGLALRSADGAAGLARLRHAVGGWVEGLGADRQYVDEVVLAVGEALANSVEHAYLGREQPGVVALDASVEGAVLTIAVRDFGEWRVEAAPGLRGRGLAMMRQVMDDVVIEPTPQGTKVLLRRALEGRP